MRVDKLLTNAVPKLTRGFGKHGGGIQQIRFHHPSPFDPQTTKGWKAAKKVCHDNYCTCTSKKPSEKPMKELIHACLFLGVQQKSSIF